MKMPQVATSANGGAIGHGVYSRITSAQQDVSPSSMDLTGLWPVASQWAEFSDAAVHEAEPISVDKGVPLFEPKVAEAEE